MNLVDQYNHHSVHPFLILGNRLCIDFANTAFCPASKLGKIHSLSDLFYFYEVTEVLDRAESLQLQKIAVKDKVIFEMLFERFMGFRKTVQAVVSLFRLSIFEINKKV